MSENQLKKGDKLLCVDDSFAPTLTKGEVYTFKNYHKSKPSKITAVWGDLDELKIEEDTHTWRTNRFVKMEDYEAAKKNEWNIDTLREFEMRAAEEYAKGQTRYPIHLRASADGSYESNLISIFKRRKIRKGDYYFGYWDSHIPALLKGVPEQEVWDAIFAGDSIALSFPEYNFYCSGIVDSLFGVACGVAHQLKRIKSDNRVYCYVGDMSSFCGGFHTAATYANNFNLPLTFIMGDNGHSVMTDTAQTWGLTAKANISKMPYRHLVDYFEYKNMYPHSGLQQRISF